jgi:PleD family two-component response regulator
VSIGVKVPNGGALIDSIEEADKALLKAKQNGGNQVVMVSDEDA